MQIMLNTKCLTNILCQKLLICVLIVIKLQTIQTKLNFYVNKDEVQALLGLNAEIYYIRNGKVNDYALKFVVTVPVDRNELHFTWISAVPKVKYSLGFRVSDDIALETPRINISHLGYVPLREQVFRVSLPCTGRSSAEVEVQILVNITMSSQNPFNETELILKRKKICIKSDSKQTNVENVVKIEEKVFKPEEPVFGSSAPVFESTNPLSIAVACASGLILVVALLALSCYFFYVRSQKERQTQTEDFAGSLTNLSSSKSGQTYLRVDTPNHPTINKTGSHYSSFRGFLNAPHVSLYRTLSVPVHIHTQHNRVNKMDEQLSELSVEKSKILLQQKLYSGTFGEIYCGLLVADYNDVTAESKVMIKTVSNQASKLQISLIMTEGMRFYSLKHHNLLSITGTCTEDPLRPLLLYPLMNSGILKLFLQKSSAHKFPSEAQVQTFLTQDLVQMAIQIASAVIYLHKRRIIHRDLGTRNCFLQTEDNSFLVKVSDNALSRDIFPNDYHCLGDNENRPVKWLALESLLNKEFTQSSDVWSFGVTLWELMTLGQQPYFEVDPFEMADYLRDGYRLFQPINCPDKLYDIMVCCWNAIPENRPTFPQLLSCLDDFHQTLGEYI